MKFALVLFGIPLFIGFIIAIFKDPTIGFFASVLMFLTVVCFAEYLLKDSEI